MLRYRDLRRVLWALAASASGDWLYNVALVVFVYDQTHSAGWVAATSVARLAPYFVFGTWGGLIAERYEKRRVMVFSDVIRAGMMFGLAITAAFSGAPLVALVLTFLCTLAGTAYLPALTALTPALVKERELGVANGLMQTVNNVASIAGPAIGALVLVLGPPSVSFIINGCSFILSAFLSMSVKAHVAGHPLKVKRRGDSIRHVFEGLRTLREAGGPAIAGTFYAASGFIYGTQSVLLLLVATRLLDTGEAGYGWMYAALGAGGVLAIGVTNRLVEHPNTAIVSALAISICGWPLAALAIVDQPLLALFLLLLSGAGNIMVDVITATVLQRSLRANVVARVFGVLDSLTIGAMLVGSMIAPLMADVLGLRVALAISGGIIPVVTLINLKKLRAMHARAMERMIELSPKVDLLRGMDVFESTSRQSLEWLADLMSWTIAFPGDVVITQGEPAEDFYAVAQGDLDVLVTPEAGGPPATVATLHAGDYFGEIGLVENVARTATVRARSEVLLFRINGENFLEALNEAPTISGTARNAIVRRLAQLEQVKGSEMPEVKDTLIVERVVPEVIDLREDAELPTS